MAYSLGVCSCTQAMDKPQEKEPPSNSSTLGVAEPARPIDACFDCSICFDCAVEPVVTLCGHLYCWPCVYQWMQLESISQKQCPVCKARLSQETLVPLYGRGRLQQTAAKGDSDVPQRPTPRMPYDHAPFSYPMQQQLQFHQDNSHVSGSFGLGGFVSVDPPFVSGIHGGSLYHEQSYYLTLNGSSTRLRQLMHLECLLHQASSIIVAMELKALEPDCEIDYDNYEALVHARLTLMRNQVENIFTSPTVVSRWRTNSGMYPREIRRSNPMPYV